MLNVFIQKNEGTPELQDLRLLVIAKYSDDYYIFNFYTKPMLENGSGTDVIVLSRLNLSSVTIEVVDGIQQNNPVFFGFCTYHPEV